MHLQQAFRRALKVAQLDKDIIRSVASDRHATGAAILMIALGSVAGAIGSVAFPVRYGLVIYRPTLWEAFQNSILAFVLVIAAIFLLHVAAEQIFKAKGSFHALLRVVGFGYVVGLLNVLPVLSFVVAIWMVVLIVKSLMEVKHLSMEQSIISVIGVAVVLFVVFSLFSGLDAANLYGGLYVGPY